MRVEHGARFQRRIYRLGVPGFWHDVPTGDNSKNYKEWRRLITSGTLRPINIEVTTTVDPDNSKELKVKAEWGYPNKGKANSHKHIVRNLEQGDPKVVTVQLDHPRRTIIFRDKGTK